MMYRIFPRTGWKISEIGFGMWGMGSWSGSDDDESLESLEYAVSKGCNFFDTAFNYGMGHSERLLGKLLKNHPENRLYSATKIPPKNFKFPGRQEDSISDILPPPHIREYTEKSLKNLDINTIDLIYFHVWDDSWASDLKWQKEIKALKNEKLINSFGISINRWEPVNVIKALRTGLVDAVQVVYNIFDQAPEDELFPVCEELKIAVIARVPFDEGTLTGNLALDSKWAEGDFRNTYFKGENLAKCVSRAEKLKRIVPDGMTLPEMTLKFILSNPAVTSIIPGMRKRKHVDENIKTSGGKSLPADLINELKKHRWNRDTNSWIR